jgi:hypothetical protein
VDEFLEAAKFRSDRRWLLEITWSSRLVNILVKVFLKGSIIEIGRT